MREVSAAAAEGGTAYFLDGVVFVVYPDGSSKHVYSNCLVRAEGALAVAFRALAAGAAPLKLA